MGFEDTDAAAEGTPGMETVLEPEWVGTREGRGGSVACGEYTMVPAGLVTTMCVFPFISSETSHIMGLNTSFINSGTEAKQKAQATLGGFKIDVDVHSDVGSIKEAAHGAKESRREVCLLPAHRFDTLYNNYVSI